VPLIFQLTEAWRDYLEQEHPELDDAEEEAHEVVEEAGQVGVRLTMDQRECGASASKAKAWKLGLLPAPYEMDNGAKSVRQQSHDRRRSRACQRWRI
jgi:hypothetical protein